MMRVALAAVLALHGIAHLVGFAWSWGYVKSADLPYKTTILGSAIDLGEVGIRVYGIVWMLLAGAFLGASAAVGTRAPQWHTCVFAAVGVSIVMCVLSLPATRIGLAVNAAIIAWVLVGTPRGWFPGFA